MSVSKETRVWCEGCDTGVNIVDYLHEDRLSSINGNDSQTALLEVIYISGSI